MTRNTWKVAAAVTRCGTLRVSWQAHLADPSPAARRELRPPDPSLWPAAYRRVSERRRAAHVYREARLNMRYFLRICSC